jgi:DNA-binding transcriptional MerR regulator
MTVRLTIGELSKMTYLSVKALRHYHEVGLLEPAEIDPSSGYRRYTADQVATAQAIRRFRDLDMPLDQVRTVLSASDPATRNATILAHLEVMQAKLERTQQTVASLHALLSGGRPPRPVTYRTLAAQPVLAVRATVAFDAAGGWLEDGFAAVHRAVEAAGLTPAGPDGALYDEAFFTEGAGEVVAFVPVEAGRSDRPPAAPAGDRVVALDLPATRVAAMVHDGPFDELDQTYGALGTVVAELGLGADGPIREIYLADDRAEVCWPITTTSTTTTTGSTP